MAQSFPSILTPYTEGWRIQPYSKGGSPSIVGTKQTVAVPNGFWKAKGSFYITTREELLEARGFLAGLDGQAGEFLVGPYDYRGAPWNIDPLTGARITPDLAALDAAADPAFGLNPDTTGVLQFSLAANVAANATSAMLTRTQGGHLTRGQYFSIGQRMHIITGLTTADPTDAGSGQAVPGQIGITFRPWARSLYTAGSALEFGRPQSLMKLATDDIGQIDLTTSPVSDLPLDFVEAL
ncbi:hypothetical protein [Methylobacterium sp. WL8]|uniref:hypothetical protein n=1 Tax=Methylobacterium sp. WL8 TaxID=2603899 RepID=UPI0011CC927E|nr:hypothetical protein [Methylobacterium sp. WL8]TXN79302.1 hypothetical protein FV234_21080 [Methylobacterium sp. WL8]